MFEPLLAYFVLAVALAEMGKEIEKRMIAESELIAKWNPTNRADHDLIIKYFG